MLKRLGIVRGNRLLQFLAVVSNLSRFQKRIIVIATDSVLCALAALFAILLRMGELDVGSPAVADVIAASLCFWLPVFLARGIYTSIMRYAGARTMIELAKAVFYFTIPMVVLFMIVGVTGVPRTIAILHPIVFLAMLCTSRLIARYIFTDLLNADPEAHVSSVLIYGAGSTGQQLAMSIRPDARMELIAFVDDDERLHKQKLDGVRIYHSAAIPDLIERYHITDILLAMPSQSRARRRAIVEALDDFPVRVRTLPNLVQIIDGKVSINDLREIQIEDLLGRDPVPPNELLLGRTIVGKTVMVTGAGGSIGSELCRQIAEIRPKRLILVESSEFSLYSIDKELQSLKAASGGEMTFDLVPELANVADRPAMRRLMTHWTPDTVFHAAAYKHVPLVEANPISGIRNNVFGALHTALEAERVGVANFVLISTDKAVRPTNVMGTSKRICELILQARAQESSKTCFTMVRFGNVLGSSGSVVPLFQQQIRAGGPVSVTHREVTRFFMTIPEASQLVIQAGAMAKGGEVFVLDMGQPVRIWDLAESMIHLSGLTIRNKANPHGDIEIVEVGLRPGEKMYEELLIGENPAPTKHARIMKAHERMIEWSTLERELAELDGYMDSGDRDGAIAMIKRLVPEYAPTDETPDAAQLQAI